ncbi:MAG: transglutaminase-like cysteine peptidase [Alphaproteobacteria bacterium]|nr:transglutaminase-like cysteine peptidase [Alphaproteobacteria bacterium]
MPAPLANVFAPNQSFSSDISAFNRYTDMLARFQFAMSSGDESTATWRQIIHGFRNLHPMLQIIQVNETMNRRPYHSEARDYWSMPGEFLKYGGDCEDFAIAKYLALRDLGFDETSMRIVIVNDLQKHIPHAILAVRLEGTGEYVLDNQYSAVRRSADIHRYSPIYSINRTGWWYHGRLVSV